MTRLALLWHMHQPFYQDLATGEHILPWVRLHALKDYLGMAAVVREFPQVRVTFNLVPALLVQIQAFAEDRAWDRHLEIGLKPADTLDRVERLFLVANGFHASADRMIKPYPRYAELYQRRRAPDRFSAADVRDLQVWHKLAWMDPDWLARDARLLHLVGKQQHYTEEDKQVLRQVELEILRAVIPEYRELAATTRIELSTSPFYHPILPLLCNSDVHFVAHPHSALPRHRFARPADAAEQLSRAMAFHAALFGTTPHGVWPSEGSLSDEVVGLLAERGRPWTATDEEILERTLQRPLTADDLYRPYEIGSDDRTVRCLFRDHALSDLIGFAYQAWDADRAANDFVGKVREAGRRFDAAQGSELPGGEVPVVTVILDGENAWEYYAGGGRPFLRALYGKLQDARDIEMVTMSEAAAGPARALTSIYPGSWINGDFYIWAGHADDHRAWGQLAAARVTFDQHESRVDAQSRERAWEELLIAEGSDWFWWYGDDHSSDHDHAFDDLFRRHLRNVYRALGVVAPDDLHISNITTQPPAAGPLRPQSLLTPRLNPDQVGYGDWVGAAQIPLAAGGATMHRVAGQLVRTLRLAVDRVSVLCRLEGAELCSRLSAGDVELALLVERPVRHRIEVPRGATAGARWVVGREVAHLVVPFRVLGAQARDRLSLSILVTDPAGHVIEQHPGQHSIELEVPTRHVSAIHWRV